MSDENFPQKDSENQPETTIHSEPDPVKSEKETEPDSDTPVARTTEPVVEETDGDYIQEDVQSSDDDEEKEEEQEEKSQKDYASFSKKQLISELDKLLKSGNIPEIKHDVEEIRSEFESKFNEEMEQKKKEFLDSGESIIDFHYTTPLKKEFNSLYFDYREKRNKYYRNLKKDLQANLQKRWELIEELKGLLDAEENINTTYKQFKNIQERWHLAGSIPRDKYNTVWNTYHHHVENFYDFLHLNREFRDLDFKHNLEAKLKLITRAEELAQEEDVSKAFRELQMLHRMWKEDLGPVAKEYREEVWNKFSEATKVIHDRRQAYLAELEKEFEVNYDKKKEIIDQIAQKKENQPTTHHGWQKEIKKVEALREEFFKIGRVPRTKNKEIWRDFKEATRSFNREKNSFYKNLKKEQYDNLQKKRELVQIAEENKDSDDFETVTPLMKKIQSDWKTIGFVPRKYSDKIWKQFKNACNHYFDRLHALRKEENKEEFESFENKEKILKELDAFELSNDYDADLKKIKSFISTWKKEGKVPYSKRHIERKFNKTLDRLFSQMDMSKKEKELIKFDNKLNTLVNRDDEQKLQNEHFYISKKIEETRDQIRQLENNLGFFHNVDKNNPTVREVYNNIARHKDQLEVWKAKLVKIREVRDS